MSNNLNKIQLFIIESIPNHSKDLVKFVAKKFKISPQGVHKHLIPLINEKKVLKSGNTRNTLYTLPSSEKSRVMAAANWTYPVNDQIGEQEIWDTTLKPKLESLKENVKDIVEYGFTEMVNNVKDHSQAKQLLVSYKIIDETLHLKVQDNGIGIFRKIRESLGLPTLREAILDLSKGKLTTDHTRHSGEGIFFSSRVFDQFVLTANGLSYVRLNTELDEDWLIGDEVDEGGTSVAMSIALNSNRTREEVFRKFTSNEDFSFSKTHVAIELGLLAGETYVSRSQAKRILSGLERFRFIVLNFKRVKSVGQGFVDEVFRVFKNAHPDIQIDVTNTNESVDFMIRRGLGSK